MTGRIIIDIFSTLDGVAQAPGGPEEDASGGFRFGGWQEPVSDDVVGGEIRAGLENVDALLLGRLTYDIWADYWPHHTAAPIGALFARLPKYVASRGKPQLDWEGSTLLGPDLASEVEALRERHENIHVIGSIDLVQSLLAEELYDELNLWVFPLVLGEGKKVFPTGAAPATLRLLAPPVVATTGAVLLRYGPAGAVVLGDMTQHEE